MAAIKILPSAYAVSDPSAITVENEQNMYTPVDSTTTATVTVTGGSGARYIYLYGFDIVTSLPAGVTVTNISVSYKNRTTSYVSSGSNQPYVIDNQTDKKTTPTNAYGSWTGGSSFTNYASTITIDNINLTGEQLRALNTDFTVRLATDDNRRTIYIYGCELNIEYEVTKYINKVIYGSETLIDLTNTTATADKILVGYGAYGADGAWMDGTATGGSGDGYVWQDQDGYIHLSDEPGTSVSVEALSVTQNGTYTAPTGKAYSPVAVNVSGGGVTPTPKKQINFIDYDGTILHSYTKSEWQGVASLPSNPSHTGLTAQGWNWTKAQIDVQLTAMPNDDVWVGQMYITSSGKTEIDIELNNPDLLSPYLKFAVNGTAVVDWGDGSANDTVTSTSLTGAQYTSHTYASTGNYTITIEVTSGSFTFYNSYILSHTNSTSNASRRYNSSIVAVRLGSGVTSIGTYAFCNCYSIQSVTIPSGVTSIRNYALQNCYSLQSVTIPSGVTSIGTYALQNCYSLQSVTIPSGVTSIGAYAFYGCSAFQSVTIPSGVTSIGNNAFYACYSLQSVTITSGVTSIETYAFCNCYSIQSVTIPSGVTSIGTYAFCNCYSIYELHFLPTTPSTVANRNAFTNLQADCIIYVPTGTLSDYTSATNYPSSATYTYMEE